MSSLQPPNCQAQKCEHKAVFMCSLCQKSYYCTEKHQKQTWSIHRFNCGELPIPEHDRPPIAKISFGNSVSMLSLIELTSYQDEQYDDQGPQVKRQKKLKKQQQTRRQEQKQRKKMIVQQNRNNNKEVKLKGKSMKQMLERRDIERSGAFLNYFTQNYPAALHSCRRVSLTSQRIINEMNQPLIIELEHTFLIKTTKLLQQIQFLLDTLLLIKIYICLDKTEDIRETIRKIKFPNLNPKPPTNNLKIKQQRIQYNTWRQQVTQMQCILKCFFQITAKKDMAPTTLKIALKYIEVVQQAYGQLELATAYFMVGYWKADIGNNRENKSFKSAAEQQQRMEEAKSYFVKCLEIREKYGDSMPLSDVLLNLAIVEWNMLHSEISSSVEKIERSLKIRKNIIGKPSLQYTFSMQLLGRLYMLNGQFQKSYNILFECFQLQQILIPAEKLLNQSYVERTKIEVLIIFLFKNISNYIFTHLNHVDVDDFRKLKQRIKEQIFDKYERFEEYAIDDHDLVAVHFNMVTSQQLLEVLTAKQMEELSRILVDLEGLSYHHGINHFRSSEFFNKLEKEKRTMILISNPNLDKNTTPTHRSTKYKMTANK